MQRTLVALLSALAMVLVACAPEDPGGPVSPTTTTEAPTTTTSGDSTTTTAAPTTTTAGDTTTTTAAPTTTTAGDTTTTTAAPTTTTTEAPTTTTTAAPTTTTTTAPTPVTDGLAVSGNTLVAGGEPVRLLGVNRSGSEYACIQGFGIFDGPVDDAAIDAIASWNVNTVRIPMNEDCWLGQNAPAQYSGENYRSAIEDFVNRLNAAGMYAVLDLHWSGPNSDPATGQTHLADAQDAPDFWASVAERFEDNPNVAFDLYNEPHNVSWDCWLNGCETQGFQAAGMQELVDAVRSTGATQPIILTGLRWGNDLTGWLSHMPDDPQDALVAGFHLYNFNACIDSGCWGSEVGSVAAQVPVVTGELGENDCSASFINGFMDWADANGVSYLGWAWNTYSCGGFPALITDYDGTPTAFGAGLKARLAEVNG